jgi:hypothetical protein
MTERIQWYDADGLRWCCGCQCYMGIEQFHRNRASLSGDGLQTYCRLCARAARRRTYLRHREREIARSLAYQRTRLGPDASPQQRERLRAQRKLARRVWYLRTRLAMWN